MKSHQIKIRLLAGNLVEGKINQYFFKAKVYNKNSPLGIENGRTYELDVCDGWDELCRVTGQGYGTIIQYERRWCKEPSTPEHKEILKALVNYFANFPD